MPTTKKITKKTGRNYMWSAKREEKLKEFQVGVFVQWISTVDAKNAKEAEEICRKIIWPRLQEIPGKVEITDVVTY